ncbi:MAG: hypothetical protein QOD74_1170 [Variibacter sp.]|nr:hypothetical protein [Variibacter sp.]
MSIEDDIALLEDVPSFRPLGREALRVLAIGAETKPVAEGEVLFREGELADAGYVVENGSFALSRTAKNKAPAIAGPGSLFGEAALLTETKRPVTATAREPSSVIRISRPLFLKMLQGYPETAERMRELMLARVERLAAEIEAVRDVLGTQNQGC